MSRTKIILAVLVLAALAAGAYFSFLNPAMPQQTQTRDVVIQGQDATAQEVSERPVPDGMKRYVHPSFLFSFFVPQETQIERRPEAGGAETTTFEFAGTSTQFEFQIYIAPYTDDQITQSQIAKDTHKTQEGSPQEIVIGSGMHALAFYSSDPALGRLREVWFIMNGHLFEATAEEGYEADLLKVLQTLELNRA